MECFANFDLTYYPYRRIEVFNDLCLRSQVFVDFDPEHLQDEPSVPWTIKYNAMVMEQEYFDHHQFSPYFFNYNFGAFEVTHNSQALLTGQNDQVLRDKEKVEGTIMEVRERNELKQ